MAARFKWWKASAAKVHAELIPTVQNLNKDMQLETRYTELINEMQNRNYGGLTPGKIGQGAKKIFEKAPGGREKMAINTTANIAETLAARICGTQPKPRALTVMGDYSQRRRAQQTDRGVAGIFHEQDAYEHTEQAFRDCEAVGLGHVKVVEDVASERVVVERLVPGEVLWDEDACPNGKPRQRFQQKWVPSDTLAERFPRKEKQITKAAGRDEGQISKPMVATELVYVVEGWHTPAIRGGKGRHVIAVDGATLFHEEWNDEYDPIGTIGFIPPFIGAQAQGLVEYLRPLQQELNAVSRRIQRATQIGATQRTYYERGVLDKKQLTNEPGDIVELNPGGIGKVRTDAPSPLAGEVIRMPDWYVRMMHDSSGMSQLSASGRKPADVESGIAMRTLQDIEQLRFALIQRRYDRLLVHMYHLAVRAASRLVRRLKAKEKGDDEAVARKTFLVTSPTKGGLLWEVDWAKTLKDTDNYSVQTWPTNLLPSTPGAKLATVHELLQMQLITQDVANALLDFPDLDLTQSLYASEVDLVDWHVEQMLDGKTFEAVNLRGFQDPQVVVQRASQQARMAVLDGAPESMIAELTKYIAAAAGRLDQTKALQQGMKELEAMKEQQAQAAPAPAAAPPAAQ